MPDQINRRTWLRSSLLGAGALTAGSLLSWQGVQASPAHVTSVPPIDESPWDLTKMKARLTSNENPFGPSEKAIKAMQESLRDGWMYPKMGRDEFRQMIADMWGVTTDHVLLGAGSSEILMSGALLYGGKGSKILAADLTYMSLIRKACNDYGSELMTVPLTSDMDYDFDRMADAVTDDISLVYICNPNNPTGKLTKGNLKAFCAEASKKKPVFVDEAYIDYQEDPAKESMISLVKEGKNVIVARTFSKVHAMAGLRIGYAIATPENIEKLKIYSTDGNTTARPSIMGAIETLKDQEFMAYSRKMNQQSKDYLYKVLADSGYEYVPSDTNFVLFPIRMNGDRFVMEMMKRGVGLKRVVYRDQHYCRVSMGTLQDMEYFANAFSELS
jgi:histidinol-phosphate aminotransferase